MDRSIVTTRDGSSTIFVPELDEHYHSIHGAWQESMHVFIKAGLHQFPNTEQLNILEVGFGTGLNALLTAIEAEKTNQVINYVSLEKYPVTLEEIKQLNYTEELSTESSSLFNTLHTCDWERFQKIIPQFNLKKCVADLKQFSEENAYHLIYFDAFAPSAQADLWTVPVFERMFNALHSGGMLVTYCVKGDVRRNMRAAGFTVEKIPGPPGKREMARALKGL